jgi:DNA helicase II / ATP-dependent DNA helicase PcrA
MNELKNWLLEQQPTLDNIIAQACNEFWQANKANQNFSHDLYRTHLESYELCHGRDLCYDRNTTALTYTLWYHPRRINTFLSFFLDHLTNFPGQKIQLFDLGAGTGAVQWAILLIAIGLRKCGKKPPPINIVNIDTSPFMLHFNRDFLWKYFIKEYDLSLLDVNIEYEINSWNNNNNNNAFENTIISSSYLFDASDNTEKIKQDFIELVKKYDPDSLLLLTSKNKSSALKSLSNDFLNLGYAVETKYTNALLFDQPLNSINDLRENLSNEHPKIKALTRDSSWEDTSYSGLIISKKQMGLGLLTSPPINKINLFGPPIRFISEMTLNDKQKKASIFSEMPSVIIGPAGCGKSIVISQKVFNTIEENNYDPNLKILITTFNKSLISQLTNWLKELLEPQKAKYSSNNSVVFFHFNGSSIPNITLLHFDILPLRIGTVPFNDFVDEQIHLDIMTECINTVKNENGITNNENLPFLNPDFLLEEYHRVIYGLQVGIKNSEEVYQGITRLGRGNNPSLPKNSNRRKLVFQTLKKYAIHIYREDIPSFTVRRQRFLSELNSFPDHKKYDFLFVDEFQDCTQADFKIFNQLLVDPDRLCVAGDLAQAVHIGKSAKIPRFEDMARRKFHRLEHSFRLPVRVSEAIKPISEAIQLSFNNDEGVGVITPYKGSPPGARPIVVYSPKLKGIADKIQRIHQTYSIYDIGLTTILEKDNELAFALNQMGVKSETDTILRLKGLEKKCIIWSTRMNIEFEKEVYEFVYTILSRTSSILIITLSDNTLDIYKPVIGKLNKDRLILWDEETENKFSNFCEPSTITKTIDE